ALYDKVFRPNQFKAPKPLGPAYQFQVFVDRDEMIDGQRMREAQEILFKVVRDLRPKLFGKGAPAAAAAANVPAAAAHPAVVPPANPPVNPPGGQPAAKR